MMEKKSKTKSVVMATISFQTDDGYVYLPDVKAIWEEHEVYTTKLKRSVPVSKIHTLTWESSYMPKRCKINKELHDLIANAIIIKPLNQ